MSTHSINTYPNTFKVTYQDPAGGFAGWFLHTIGNVAALQFSEGTWNSNADYRQALIPSVEARLAQMFGRVAVTYSIDIVETVTPAVIDTDY